MNYKIVVQPTVEREAKRLNKRFASFKEDFTKLLDAIETDPHLGIDLGNNLRKIRMRITSKGKGKSGGARVITFTVVVSLDEAEINLIYIYDKAERESLKSVELEELLSFSTVQLTVQFSTVASLAFEAKPPQAIPSNSPVTVTEDIPVTVTS